MAGLVVPAIHVFERKSPLTPRGRGKRRSRPWFPDRWRAPTARAVQVVISPTAAAPRVTASFHRTDLGRGLRGMAGRGMNALGNVARGRVLCSCTAVAMLVETPVSSPMARAIDGDFLHRALGRVLDGGDLLRDIVGGARGLVGERLHFGGDHGKALAGLAGARRLDRGIERQQIGLRRDRGNGADHRADALGGVVERADGSLACARRRRRRIAPCRAAVACWPISWIEPDSSSVARTVASMRCAVSADADEAEPHAARRVVGDLVQRRAGRRQRNGRFLDRLDHFADGAGEFGDRASIDGAAPLPRRVRRPGDAASWRWRRRS